MRSSRTSGCHRISHSFHPHSSYSHTNLGVIELLGESFKVSNNKCSQNITWQADDEPSCLPIYTVETQPIFIVFLYVQGFSELNDPSSKT